MRKTGTVFNIQRFCTDDGPGIRTTVFLKGCNLRCAWCHNPESQAGKAQWMFYPDKCIGCGRCKDIADTDTDFVCYQEARALCGKEYSVEEILEEALKDTLFYQNSGGGVTFSGGECMLQIDFLEACLKGCKEKGLHTAVDTAGHIPFESFARILPYTDLFLYDVKAMDREKHQAFTGVPNDLILDNLSKLLSMGKAVWVRVPVIPTVNDTVEEMTALRRFLEKYGHPEKVELLPYHALGEHKYAAIGKKATSFQKPEDAALEQLRILFKELHDE